MSKYLYAKHPSISHLAIKINTKTNLTYVLSVDKARDEFINGTNLGGCLNTSYCKEDLNYVELEVFLLLLN